MQQIEKSLVNSCGHVSQYKLVSAEGGVDLISDINGLCETCRHEDAEFKMQVAQFFSKLFERFD